LDHVFRSAIEKIHESPVKMVVAVTGGGVQAISWLLTVPGASRTVLECRVPYSGEALREFLGFDPAQAASQATAVAMARASLARARLLAGPQAAVLGVGCTAALATDRPKRGEHRCHVAVADGATMTAWDLVFEKGRRSREEEDDLVSRLVLSGISSSVIAGNGVEIVLAPPESVTESRVAEGDRLGALLAGWTDMVVVNADGGLTDHLGAGTCVLPGSFNPVHEGHEGLARAASGECHAESAFEISVTNVDKPPLGRQTLDRRLKQFSGRHTVVVTRAPTFAEKARLMPGSVFVIGADTAERLVDPEYYGGSPGGMLAALRVIRERRCRFIVAGRVRKGVFVTLDGISIPAEFRDLFQQLPESEFRSDVSSTEIRKSLGQQ